MKLTILQKGLLIVLLSVVLQVVCIAALYALQNEIERELDRARHSTEIVHTTEETVRDLYFTGNAVRMGRDFQIGEASRAIQRIYPKTVERLKKLHQLVGNNREEQALVTNVEGPLLGMGQDILRAKSLGQQGDIESAKEILEKTSESSKTFIPRIADGLFILLNKEKQIEDASPRIQEDVRKKIQIALVVTLVLNIGLAILLTALFNKGLAARLKTLSDNVLRLAANKPLHEPLKGSDELASLDAAFRRMAAALADARENEQALVQNAREVICSLSADLRFSSANRAVETLIGYEPSELVGTRFVSIIAPAHIEETLEYFARAKEEEITKPIENRVVCKDGTFRDFEWSVRWSAEKLSYFCVAHDVTEANRIEKMKQEFVAMVSHDLRSPLSSIQAFHECLDRGVYGNLTNDGTSSLRSVDASITRLLKLIGDLLDVEKLETGAMTLNLQPIEAAVLIEQSVFSVEDLARKKNISIEVEECDVRLNADGPRLVQVLVNLLGNAIKFSPDKSKIVIRVRQSQGDVLFQIQDFGRGIPEDQIDNVFERFAQVEVEAQKTAQGSGLGLAICKAIVSQHRGKIGVDSQLGRGSTFWFTIPFDLPVDLTVVAKH